MKVLDPKNDLVFKLLLTREPKLLLDMVQGILARPIRTLDVLNPGLPGELSTDKSIVLDIRASASDGSRIDLEMQMRALPDLAPRLVFYAARDYADQLHRGDSYHLLTPTNVIVWLVKPLFPQLERLHSIFELRDRHTHLRFSDHLAFHLLQLSALRSGTASCYAGAVARWARFLMARTDAERDRLASEDPTMALAKQTLDKLSMDPHARRLAREREDSIALYRMSLAASEARGEQKGRAEGRAEGIAQGQAKALLKQLQLRFGALPRATRARVESATIEQLDAWVEHVLTARALDDVFAP